jgi:DNA-binding NtrC family response regulator
VALPFITRSLERPTILVIDDEIGEAGSFHNSAFLRAYGGLPLNFIFESCRSAHGFRSDPARDAVVLNTVIDLVLLDIRFGASGDTLGYRILRELTAITPTVPVLMMSAVERDVEALGRCLEDGAIGFVRKNETSAQLQRSITQAIAVARSHLLLGQTPPLRELRRQAARLSPYDQVPVMIVGERGTGKERVARYIHHNGPRRNGPFIPVNCAGLSESLIEAELFGAEKGAYTGADTTRIGYLESAAHGVLFLDELGNMPLTVQTKLLRALQERSFRRVGVTSEEITADFQIVSATNEEPESLIAQKRLREDLYDRVAAVTIRTPPLRICIEDLPGLADHFLREMALRSEKRLSGATLNVFASYDWPGNMRELRRVIQEAVVVSESAPVIEPEHLAERIVTAAAKEGGGGNTVQRNSLVSLPSDPAEWSRHRLVAELRMAVQAKRNICQYKGHLWRAEFMRLMYPECKAQNAKGFNDLIRRLTKGPWGSRHIGNDLEASELLRELTRS